MNIETKGKKLIKLILGSFKAFHIFFLKIIQLKRRKWSYNQNNYATSVIQSQHIQNTKYTKHFLSTELTNCCSIILNQIWSVKKLGGYQRSWRLINFFQTTVLEKANIIDRFFPQIETSSLFQLKDFASHLSIYNLSLTRCHNRCNAPLLINSIQLWQRWEVVISWYDSTTKEKLNISKTKLTKLRV